MTVAGMLITDRRVLGERNVSRAKRTISRGLTRTATFFISISFARVQSGVNSTFK